MSNCERSAFLKLLLEDGQDAAVAAQNIAEPNRYKSSVFMLQSEKDQLGDPLCNTHDIGGSHRLVRRQHPEIFYLELPRDQSGVIGTKYIVDHGLETVVLHHRHMLVSGRMEDGIGPVKREGFAQRTHVQNVPNDRDIIQLGKSFGKFIAQSEQIVFRSLEQNQLLRVMLGCLSDDLRSDRSGCPGDQQ